MWVLDRYQILKEIAKGGTSVVVLVFDKVEQKRYVMKILEKQTRQFSCRGMRHIVNREITNLRRIKKTGIVAYQTMFEDIENYYIVLEYIDGIPLSLYGKDGLDNKVGICFMQQLISILQYVHHCGIYHMDIKPQNLLVKKDRIYLIDFGSSRQFSDTDKVPYATPMYMPMEILQGALPDQTVDIYSFGKTFYQCFSQECIKHTSLAMFLLKCCAMYKQDRFQSFADVKHSFDQLFTTM